MARPHPKLSTALVASMAALLAAGCGSEVAPSGADSGPVAADVGGLDASEDAGDSDAGAIDAASDAGASSCELTGSYDLGGGGPQRRVIFRNAVYTYDPGNGSGALQGVYEQTPDDGLVLQDPSPCQFDQRGVYRTEWSVDCTSFLMNLVEDPCTGRGAALGGVTFTRI